MSELLEFAARAAKQNKEALVAREGRADLMPMLDIRLSNGETVIVALAVDIHPTDAIVPVLLGLSAEHGPLEHVTLIVESYMFAAKPDAADAPTRNMPRGTLAERFTKGDPAVTECVTIFARDAKGNTEAAMLPFTYDRDDHLVWGEADPMRSGEGMTGAIPDALAFVMSVVGDGPS